MDEFLRPFRAFYFKEGEQTIKLYQTLGKIQNHHPLELKLLLDSKSIEKRMPKLSRRAFYLEVL